MNSKQDQPISDEHLYEQAALELRDATFGTGLYAKAFAEADGNEDKAAAIYIRLRVAGLKHGISNDGAAVQHDEIAHQYSGSASEHSRTMQGNVQSVTSDHQDTVVSPWARFWARQIDLFMVVIISEVVAGLLGFAGYMGENLILAALFGTVVFGIMGVLYETALIAFMGTTVGKALFALSVKDRSGRNLSVSDSFSRAWRVLWFGNALYLFFPWATLFVWWSNYKQAKKGAVSPWDKAIGTEIKQKPIGGGRFFVGAMFSVIALFLVFLLFTANKAMFRKERADALARSFPVQSAPSGAFDPTTARIVEKATQKPANPYDQFDSKPLTDAQRSLSNDASRTLLIGKWTCQYVEGKYKGDAYPIAYRNNSTYSSSSPERWDDGHRWELLADGSLVEHTPGMSSALYKLMWQSTDEFLASEQNNTRRCSRFGH